MLDLIRQPFWQSVLQFYPSPWKVSPIFYAYQLLNPLNWEPIQNSEQTKKFLRLVEIMGHLTQVCLLRIFLIINFVCMTSALYESNLLPMLRSSIHISSQAHVFNKKSVPIGPICRDWSGPTFRPDNDHNRHCYFFRWWEWSSTRRYSTIKRYEYRKHYGCEWKLHHHCSIGCHHPYILFCWYEESGGRN